MTLGAYLREAITALRQNGLRSALTAIVVTGAAGIIALSAAGGGANKKH